MRPTLSLFLGLTASAASLFTAAACTQTREAGCRLGASADGGSVLVCDDPTTGKSRDIDPAARELGACLFVGIENDRAVLRCGDQIVSIADGRGGDAGAPGKDGTSCVYVGDVGDAHEIECDGKRFTVKDGTKGEQGDQGNQGPAGTPGREGTDGQSDYTLTLEDAHLTPAPPSILDAKLGCDAKLTTTDRDLQNRVIIAELLVNGVVPPRGNDRPSPRFDFDRVRFTLPLYSEFANAGDKLQCRVTAYAAGTRSAPAGLVSTTLSPEVVLQDAALPRLRSSMLRATVTTKVVGGQTFVGFSVVPDREFSRDFGTRCNVTATYWPSTSTFPDIHYGVLDFAATPPLVFPSAIEALPASPNSVTLFAQCVGEHDGTDLAAYTKP